MKGVTVGILIMIMGVILVNQALYTHTHVMPDGSIVSHAHPFNKSQESEQGGSHQHSALEYFLLQSLQLLFLTGFAALALTKVTPEFLRIRTHKEEYIPTALIPLPGRAPPTCM